MGTGLVRVRYLPSDGHCHPFALGMCKDHLVPLGVGDQLHFAAVKRDSQISTAAQITAFDMQRHYAVAGSTDDIALASKPKGHFTLVGNNREGGIIPQHLVKRTGSLQHLGTDLLDRAGADRGNGESCHVLSPL